MAATHASNFLLLEHFNWPCLLLQEIAALFILASASPRRAELLRQLDLAFKVVPSDATEVFDGQLSPLELCQLNAHRKARAVAKKISDDLVLGADTLVFLGREIFGKPENLAAKNRCWQNFKAARIRS